MGVMLGSVLTVLTLIFPNATKAFLIAHLGITDSTIVSDLIFGTGIVVAIGVAIIIIHSILKHLGYRIIRQENGLTKPMPNQELDKKPQNGSRDELLLDSTSTISPQTKEQQELYKEKPQKSKLEDLIQELDAFRKKWSKRRGWKIGYRSNIQDRNMGKGTIEELREKSRQIQWKIKYFKELEIADSQNVLIPLEQIADRITAFTLEIESTFQDKYLKEAKKIESEKINRLLLDGDRINGELKLLIQQLESLIRKLP
ncbi:MAG: hypothetical protein WBE60_03500 [Nitrosotalea sp.]